MNTHIQGDNFNWEINAAGQLTINGKVEKFWYMKGPFSARNRPVEDGVPITINERGISIGNCFFDPNGISLIHSMKKLMLDYVVLSYQEGNQSTEIWVSTYASNGEKAKDLPIIFPSIVATAKSINLVNVQEMQKQQQLDVKRQEQLEVEQEAAMEPMRINKLKKLVQVSERLKVSQMAQILNMDEAKLYDRIVDWAVDFGFTIDEDIVKFSGGRKDDFIAAMDGAFADWGKKTETKEGKLE